MKNVYKKAENWLKKADILTISLVFFVMMTSFAFGVYKIEQAALTDEHYWVTDRTPKFWKNLVLEGDFNGTRRSDKPGVTLMFLNGPSLLKTINPEKYVENNVEHAEEVNFAFRYPVLIFAVLSLIVYFLLLKELSGKSVAVWGVVFIGLSPMLMGMSRIVNPDSLLWIFCTWAILGYLIFLKKSKKSWTWLFVSGFFMGLALLTKYVATILYVYFLGVIFLEYIFQKGKSEKCEKQKVFSGTFWSFLVFCFLSAAIFALLYPAVWVKWSRLFLGTLGSQSFEPFWKIFALIVLTILIDVTVSKAKIISWMLGFFEKYKKLIGQAIFILFILIVATVFLNVYLDNKWFDYEAVLSSPKSSYLIENKLAIFASNFYPLVFGISPLVLFFIIWISAKAALGKYDFAQSKYKVALYLMIFILLYHLSSVFSNVASTIRYQIILYPVMFVLAALGAEDLLSSFGWRGRKKQFSAYIITIIFLIIPLWTVKPFYLAYSSSLLPGEYYLDQKDMGYGSYEAAQRLNSLPNSSNILIWTDKKGVCEFFVGSCTSNLEFKELKKVEFDYYVISAGRYSRVNRLVQVRVKNNSPNTIRFDRLYDIDDAFWELEVGGRKRNFVKIIKADTVNINTIE